MASKGWRAGAPTGRSSAMALGDALGKRATRLAGDVQRSLRRARLEGERLLLRRQHRGALGRLGERAWELVGAGRLPAGGLATELQALEDTLGQMETNRREIEALRSAED